MGNLRHLLDTLGPQVAARWGEAMRYDLEMRTGQLFELEAAIERAGPDAWAATLATFLAGPKPRAVTPGLLAALRRRPARVVPAQELGLEWEAPPAVAPVPVDPIEQWSADEAAGSARSEARTAPVHVDPDEVVLAVEVDRTTFIATSQPAPEHTRYHDALLRLLGPCHGGRAVQ
jgi:hypothetical protein